MTPTTRRIWIRNCTAQRHAYAAADLIVVSLPNSGRTWLRHLLRSYYAFRDHQPFTPRPTPHDPDHWPNVAYTHDYQAHLNSRKIVDALKGKRLIPNPVRNDPARRFILLTRDLKDLMVSQYFQLTQRDRVFHGSIDDMLQSPTLGPAAYRDILLHWWNQWAHLPGFLHISYEQMHAQPADVLRQMLQRLGETRIDLATLHRSVDNASFDQMRRRETTQTPDAPRTRDRKPASDGAMKVRSGKVGGFHAHLTPRQINLIDACQRQLPFDPAAPTQIHDNTRRIG